MKNYNSNDVIAGKTLSRDRKGKLDNAIFFSWRHPVTTGHILVILLCDLIKATFIFYSMHCN